MEESGWLWPEASTRVGLAALEMPWYRADAGGEGDGSGARWVVGVPEVGS